MGMYLTAALFALGAGTQVAELVTHRAAGKPWGDDACVAAACVVAAAVNVCGARAERRATRARNEAIR